MRFVRLGGGGLQGISATGSSFTVQDVIIPIRSEGIMSEGETG